MAKLRAENSALEVNNKELINARDHFRKQAEEFESLAREAATYKKLYDELLDRVLRR